LLSLPASISTTPFIQDTEPAGEFLPPPQDVLPISPEKGALTDIRCAFCDVCVQG
jgi:hypothetical protein